MRTKIIWGGAIFTALLILSVSLYRQLKKALGVISFALSRIRFDAYMI